MAGVNDAGVVAVANHCRPSHAGALPIAGVAPGAGIAIVARGSGRQRREAASSVHADWLAKALIVRDAATDIAATAAVIPVIAEVDGGSRANALGAGVVACAGVAVVAGSTIRFHWVAALPGRRVADARIVTIVEWLTHRWCARQAAALAVANFLAVAGVEIVTRCSGELRRLHATGGGIARVNHARVVAVAHDRIAADAITVAIAGVGLCADIAIVAGGSGRPRRESADAVDADCFAEALVVGNAVTAIAARAAIVDVAHEIDALIPATRLARGAGATIAQRAVGICRVADPGATLVPTGAGIAASAAGDCFGFLGAARQRTASAEAENRFQD